jgi:hypothetical protein
MKGRAYLRVFVPGHRSGTFCWYTSPKGVNVVVSDAWNLVWILLVLVMVNRAVFCRRDEPMERIIAFLKGLAEIVSAAAVALREWRR